jgi:hypothetical protein
LIRDAGKIATGDSCDAIGGRPTLSGIGAIGTTNLALRNYKYLKMK